MVAAVLPGLFPFQFRFQSGRPPVLSLLVWCLLIIMVSSPVYGEPVIEKGVFLIANPSMADPNFSQTVVLICEHNNKEGTLGVVLNRPTELLLSEALPAVTVLKGTSYVLFVGGPVQQNGILMLFRSGKEPANTKQWLDQVYLGSNMDALARIITHPQPTETFRAYAGYAGWAPGQLEFEMSLGSWAVLQADPMSIFDKNPATLWTELVETLMAPRVIKQE